MPWEGKSRYFKSASGLPPHAVMYAYMKTLKHSLESGVRGLNEAIDSIPDKIEAMLDQRSMIGQLSLEQIARAVEEGPRLQAMAKDISALQRLMVARGSAGSAPGDGALGGKARPSECPRMFSLL